ncbi:MAG: hypothetical protein Q9163_003860 [Psora crenata]
MRIISARGLPVPGLLVPFLSLWLCDPSFLVQAIEQAPLQPTGPNISHNRLGAVASENRICSQIGIDILNEGGNAADAIVGTVFCVGVVDCHHSGIGGGGFALARAANGSYESIDFRDGVPSELRGLEYIHERYGTLPWSIILQPAINLARNGFVVSEDFAKAMDLSENFAGYDFLSEDPIWAIDFAPNGTRVGKGDVMVRKRYGRALEAIALSGADMLYRGPLAEAIIAAIQENNGTMVLKDLEDYAIISRKPVEIDYKGYHVYASGAPSSGSVTLSAMKILEKYTHSEESRDDLYIHRMTEAVRFGYGKRASFGDPDYVTGLREFELDMLSESFANATREKISDAHTLNVSAYDPKGFEVLSDHGTSHIVTADASGMAFSLTTTVNLFFGSRVMVPETGIILNNQMNGIASSLDPFVILQNLSDADFSIPNVSNAFGYYPSPANYAKPHKRPLSSIAPIMAEYANNSLYTVLGASGGSRIITTTLQNALHILDANMSAENALANPRLHDQLIPNQVTFEITYDNRTVMFMRERGHNVTWSSTAGSSGQAIVIVDGRFEAAGEPRQRDSAGLTT